MLLNEVLQLESKGRRARSRDEDSVMGKYRKVLKELIQEAESAGVAELKAGSVAGAMSKLFIDTPDAQKYGRSYGYLRHMTVTLKELGWEIAKEGKVTKLRKIAQ